MNTIINFRKKFIAAFMSILLAFMMFPFVAFADTGQEPSDTTDAVQDQATPDGESSVNNQGEAAGSNATNNQTVPEGDSTADEQDVVDSDAPTDADVTDENSEVAQQGDADANLQDTNNVIDSQATSQSMPAAKSSGDKSSVHKRASRKMSIGGEVDSVAWHLQEGGTLILEFLPGKNSGRFTLSTEGAPWSLYADEITSFKCLDPIDAHGSISRMFENCTNLQTVDFTNFNTSQVTNMSEMFYMCEKLTDINFSAFDTSNVTDMFNMFTGCKKLTSLDVSRFDTSNVTNMNNMFRACESLTSLDVSRFDTSNVTNMGFMFSECGKLTYLDLSNFNTSKVTDMSSMFEADTNLKRVNLSSFKTSKVSSIAFMFSGCENLTSLDLSSFDMTSISGFESALASTYSLTKISFGNKAKGAIAASLCDGKWQKGDTVCTSDELSNLSSSQLAGTWIYALDMRPAASRGYTLHKLDGTQLFDTWYTDVDGNTYYFGKDGYSVRYMQNIGGETYYFDGRDYTMFTGILTWKKDGRISFFDAKQDGKMSKDRWISWKGKKYYLDNNGYSVKYRQNINNEMYYFNGNGTQYTGVLVWKNDGRISFFDAKQGGKASTNRWISWKGKKYYLDKKGYSVRYLQTIGNNKYYFNKSCQMQTGVVIWKSNGKLSYFDPRQGGKMSKNRWISYKGTKYYLDKNGYSTKKVR